MGALLPILLSLLPLLASAGQLALQSPRVTITGPDASVLRNEPYVQVTVVCKREHC